ncbi:MAG TPA: hypothetical protein PLV64_12600 [Anaerolineales bacterium]|nr:hypothetical protein [Anaerolineales bacterium]
MKKHAQIITFIFLLILGCQESNSIGKNTPTTQPVPTISQPSFNPEGCLEEKRTPLDSLSLSGKLVVYTKNKDGLFDLEQNIFIELPETAKVSPDGQKVAQFDEEKKGIVISDLEGVPLIFFEKKEEWTEANEILYGTVLDFNPDYVRFDWWDNDSLFIRTLPIGSLLMLNTDNGEVREINFPYSNEVWARSGLNDIRGYYVNFSPNLDKVVYASTNTHLVLRNNSAYTDGAWRTVTWVGYSFAYSNPMWSPDGATFAVVMGVDRNINDLFQVYADFAVGERQLTDLNKLFDNPYSTWISQISWSPNGEKIAFIAGVTPNEGGETLNRLLVLDLASGTIDDYCNPDPDSPYNSGFGFTWSPDGKYIATDTAIVDLNSRVVYKIPDVYIVDWVGEGKTQ